MTSYVECSSDGDLNGDRIQLSATKSYAQYWGMWEGVREMVVNWYDGLFSSSHYMTKEELRFLKVFLF